MEREAKKPQPPLPSHFELLSEMERQQKIEELAVLEKELCFVKKDAVSVLL